MSSVEDEHHDRIHFGTVGHLRKRATKNINQETLVWKEMKEKDDHEL